jgi:hypothetical protein
MLATTDKVRELLAAGKTLVLAGEESLLRSLPKGRWIGGTIPYFMGQDGGRTSRDHVYVEEVSPLATGSSIKVYDRASIKTIAVDSPDHGYTVVILPAFSPLHEQYALEATTYDQLFFKVVAGWVAGIHLDDLGKAAPLVFAGETGEVLGGAAVALHVTLPETHRAQIGIVNIFEQGDGATIQFPASGFQATECTVNGEKRNFAEYFRGNRFDEKAPLVADFCGTSVNVSIQALEGDTVKFYAPIFEGVSYRLAKPVADYPAKFTSAIPSGLAQPIFSCNCVLNYLYGGLEGKRTGSLLGPMTFGEIAYQLLNQTLVYIAIDKV